MKKKYVFLGWFLILATMLFGCQKSPDDVAVISKSDGAYDIEQIETIYESTPTENANLFSCSDSFSSTDGSVEFYIDINQSITELNLPAVTVSPHFLTNEDAKRVANCLFNGAVYYEAEPMFAPVYSKEDILNKITRWAPYAGDSGKAGEYVGGIVDTAIKEYTLLMETAPENNPHKICEWTFKKESCYLYSGADLQFRETTEDNDQIQATVKVDEIPYLYNAVTRNKNDFKINNISARIFDGISPADIDDVIYKTKLCQTEKPSEADLDEIRCYAEEILRGMELGDWMVDECYVETIDTNGEIKYIVCVNAVPKFEDITVIRRPQLNNLTSDKVYASNYYLSDAMFQFSVKGELIYFKLFSPVDIESVVDNVKILGLNELTNLAKKFFTQSDSTAYGLAFPDEVAEEKIKCMVHITDVDVGLSRVKIANADNKYCYVPSISYNGRIEYCGADSGSTYYEEDNKILLLLNAIDGSVINLKNE